MDRRTFIGGATAGALSLQAGRSDAAPHRFRVRGIYFHDGFTVEPKTHAPLHWDADQWLRQIRWLKACGINAVEFATMLEFNRVPTTDMERRKIADRLKVMELAHSLGMKFGYILTNTVVSTVPETEEPGHQHLDRAVHLCPREPGNFEKTMALQAFYMDTYRKADFFEEFAADWGGCRCGTCGVPEYLRYVRALSEKLHAVNRRATLYANTWCISFWGDDPVPLGWKHAFDGEISGTRDVIKAMSGMPRNVGLALPCHHLYRPLTYRSYGGRAATPAYPTDEDLLPVREQGRPILAWPHFVMDDDTARAPAWGIVHLEVRYIQAMLRALRRVGIGGVMGNLYLPLLQLPNTFAYGRLCADPDADVREILLAFSRLIALREDAEKLAAVLTWMENASYWQVQMPEDGRLPDLSCDLDRVGAAKLAAQVRPNPTPSKPLPIAAEAWLADLRRSIERMDWAALGLAAHRCEGHGPTPPPVVE